MNAIISNGDYTAHIQLPIDQKQLAGALSYLGANHASAYDIKNISAYPIPMPSEFCLATTQVKK